MQDLYLSTAILVIQYSCNISLYSPGDALIVRHIYCVHSYCSLWKLYQVFYQVIILQVILPSITSYKC